MKILMVINSLSAGGAESFAAALCKEYRRREIQVTLFLFAGLLDEKGQALAQVLEGQGVTIVVPKSRRLWWVLAQLCYVTVKFAPQVIHSHLEQSDLLVWLSSKILFLRKVNRVRTLHSVYASERVPRLAHRLLQSGFDMDIACSSTVQERYPYMNTQRVCIPNGIEILAPELLQNLDLHAQFNLHLTQIALVCVGSFLIRDDVLPKAQDVIVDALAILREPRICVIFLGHGPELSAVQQQALQLGVAHQCIFAGVVPNVCDYLKASDALIMPSIFEGMPITCIEAVMCGKPMILSKIAALMPFASDATVMAQPGSAEDLAEKISHFVAHKTTYCAAATAARSQNLDTYSIAHAAGRYLTAYAACAQKNNESGQ